MKKIALVISALLMVVTPLASNASPDQDLKTFRKHFAQMFPKTPFADFVNGVYAVDESHREQWEAFEEFPSYELAIDKGKALFEKKFANGKGFSDCFPNFKKGIRQNYPYFDTATGEVVTLEGTINKCLTDNGEKPFKYEKGDIAYVSSYLAYLSRGKKFGIKIPNDPKALQAYNNGKEFFYAKRGQLNMSCADCHYTYAGRHLRANTVSPALGHPTGFPVYRNKWSDVGTLHRRYGGCNKQVRAKPFEPQSTEYRDLEYFETYMSNDLVVNGPSMRE